MTVNRRTAVFAPAAAVRRVGTGQVIPGLDEGILGMKSGGVRRLYIPGPLAFPKGVKAAAGRCALMHPMYGCACIWGTRVVRVCVCASSGWIVKALMPLGARALAVCCNATACRIQIC